MAGEDINNAERVSEEFNKFFIAKIKGMREAITPNGDDPPTRLNLHMKKSIRNRKLFALKKVGEETVLEQKKLNDTNSISYDNIPTSIIKMSAEVLLTLVTRIINTSISTGIFPDRRKVCLVGTTA